MVEREVMYLENGFFVCLDSVTAVHPYTNSFIAPKMNSDRWIIHLVGGEELGVSRGAALGVIKALSIMFPEEYFEEVEPDDPVREGDF